jgi:hypothetical protein
LVNRTQTRYADLRRLPRALGAKMKLAREDETYCKEKRQLIAKCFGRLIQTNRYNMSFIGRVGRHRSECLFGLSAPSIPRFIMGGEIGPSTWIGPPEATFESHNGGSGLDWFNMGPIADFITDRGPTWLKDVGEIREYEPGYIEQAATIIALWPTLQRMFASRESISEWKPTFDSFANNAIHVYMDKLAGT